MASAAAQPAASSAPAPARPEISLTPTRSTFAASRSALLALVLRDLVVLKKNFGEFVIRTLVQPFLLVFVFLYVFPTIGQGVGGGGGKAAESEFATVLVAGVSVKSGTPELVMATLKVAFDPASAVLPE